MSKIIKVENNQVVECLDYLPENAIGDWREAIEIQPVLIEGRQAKGSHYFDLSKTPVEIIWHVIDLSVEERKHILIEELDLQSYTMVHAELIKEFDGQNSDFVLVQNAISTYRTTRSEIMSLNSHDDIDVYLNSI